VARRHVLRYGHRRWLGSLLGVASPPLVSEPSRVHGEGKAPTRGVRVAQADALEHARLACHRVPYLAERGKEGCQGLGEWWRRVVEADEAVVAT
jgi:hypothetical protein